MPNLNSSTIRPSKPDTDTGATRVQQLQSKKLNKRRGRNRLLVAGAVVAIGAMAGTGFVLQSVVVAQNESIAATTALANSTGLASEQLTAYSTIADAHAARAAKATILEANTVIAAADGKADASDLASSVAALNNFELLTPGRVFSLVDATKSKSAGVQAATAEVDRVAAEAAAQAAAAAEAAAAAAAKEASATSSGSSSGGSRPSAPSDPSGAQAIARDLMAAQYGWGEDQFGCLVALWAKESGWNVNAYNASSGATGIPQALPGSKMASAGADWQTNPATQITWGLGYIAGRYGTPCGAWDTSQAKGWY